MTMMRSGHVAPSLSSYSLVVVLTEPAPAAGHGGAAGHEHQHGHQRQDDDERSHQAGSFSLATFWLTTCEEPPGAMVTP